MPNNKISIIPAERIDDLHNLHFADDCDLVLFMAGNQFMVMDELIALFQAKHPDIKRIYYETLPPGLELKQILAGGAMFRDRFLAFYPDIYASVNEFAMNRLEKNGHLEPGDYHLYLHNRLVLMTPRGNPADIKTVSDLGQKHVRISQPDPENEDIGFHIMDMYRDAGGDKLVRRIMEEKRADKTSVFTKVHHRETPLLLKQKRVDVGPVWATEAIYANNMGTGFETIEPGKDMDQQDRINYYVCKLKKAPHPENGIKFLEFIRSEPAQKIYEKAGFGPHLT